MQLPDEIGDSQKDKPDAVFMLHLRIPFLLPA